MNNFLQMEITVDYGHWVALAHSHPPLAQVTPMVIFYYKKHCTGKYTLMEEVLFFSV